MNILIICLLYHSIILTHALVFDNPSSLEGRLGEGYPAFKPLPYVAGLYECEELYCSGVLISDKHILTVAKCLERFFTDPLTDFMNYHAKLGSDCLYEAGWSYYFIEVKIHKKFDLGTESPNYNIGVITLDIPNYKGKIKQWIPWENRKLVLGAQRYLMGWGEAKSNHPGTVKALLFAEVSLINTREECLLISNKTDINKDKLICTIINRKRETRERNFEMENVDLGAPLVNPDGKLVGILCFFKLTEKLKKYGIHINIRAYRNWINEVKREENNRTDCGTNYRISKLDDIFKGVNFEELVEVKQEPEKDESVKHEPIIKDSIMNELVKEEPAVHESVKEGPVMHEAVQEESVIHEAVQQEPKIKKL